MYKPEINNALILFRLIFISTNTFAQQRIGHRLAVICYIKAPRGIITSTMNVEIT